MKHPVQYVSISAAPSQHLRNQCWSSCWRWVAAASCHGRQECGKRANEGGHDCFTSSIIVSGFAPLALMVASLSNTKTSCQSHKTNHFRCEGEPNVASPPFFAKEAGQSSRFSIQLQKQVWMMESEAKNRMPESHRFISPTWLQVRHYSLTDETKTLCALKLISAGSLRAIREPDRPKVTDRLSAQGCTTQTSCVHCAWPVLSQPLLIPTVLVLTVLSLCNQYLMETFKFLRSEEAVSCIHILKPLQDSLQFLQKLQAVLRLMPSFIGLLQSV